MGEYIRIDTISLAVLDTCDYYNMGIIITRINVQPKHRGKGYGRALLKKICDKADIERFDLWLEINSYGDLSYEQLQEWYERHGFKEEVVGMFRRRP